MGLRCGISSLAVVVWLSATGTLAAQGAAALTGVASSPQERKKERWKACSSRCGPTAEITR